MISADFLENGLCILTIGLSLLAFVYYRRMVLRVKGISESLKRFETGDYSERLPVRGRDRLSHVEEAVNRLMRRIENDMNALKESNSLRRELVANISHDLKSPLTCIRGYLETLLLKDGALPSGDRKEYIEVTLRNTRSLIQLVDDLFELSKLDTKANTVRIEPLNMPELVDTVLSKYRPRALDTGIQLELVCTASIPFVAGDMVLLDRALSNLIDNALVYTPPGGKVEALVTHTGNRVLVSVSDTGIGIPEKDLPLICNRFYRVDKDRSRDSGGTGLGLAITKRILEIHNSCLAIKSKIGTGTSFTFDLQTIPARLQTSHARLGAAR